MTVKIYAERDPMALDKAGNHYCRHVSAMTSEELHSKSDIAAELGWRDMQIAELQRKVEALAVENASMKEAITDHSNSTHFCPLCGKDDDCSTDDVCSVLKSTPATDTALAEIHDRFINDAVSAIADSGAQTVGDAIAAVASMRKESGR